MELEVSPGRRPRLATLWLGGCSGCHMSFLDLDERLLELAQRVELCASPLADVKSLPPVDLCLIEGAVANEDHRALLAEARAKARCLVAFGDCAVTGNVTALRNGHRVEDVLERVYRQQAQVVRGVPRGDGVVPRLLERVLPLHALVEVDYFLTGCPPSAGEIWELLTALLEGRPPRLSRRFG